MAEASCFPEGSAEGRSRFGEEFESLISAFLAAGVMLSDPQIYQAAQEWEHVPAVERAVAVLCAQVKAKTNEAKFMGLPANFLRKAEWTAKGTGRTIPLATGRKDRNGSIYSGPVCEHCRGVGTVVVNGLDVLDPDVEFGPCVCAEQKQIA